MKTYILIITTLKIFFFLQEHNYLFWLLGVGHTTKEDVHRLGAALQLDLFDPGQQKEVAIMLCREY